MRSFVDLERTFGGQPAELGGMLSRVDTGRGREQLFLDQRPELLRALSESARVASISASNAIEGVFVEPARAEKIAEGTPYFRNRGEKEFAGYRDALDSLIRAETSEPLTVPFVLHLHRQMLHHSGGRGGHLKREDNQIVSYADGRKGVIFVPPGAAETEHLLTELLARYSALQAEGDLHPLVLISALVLDFLAIHPVADGNGRLARLLTIHQMLAQGYGVARYISLEQRILESKNTYYDRLYASQQGWHDGSHDIWPWTQYLIRTIEDAYDDFERRVAAAQAAPTNKQERVREHVLRHAADEFRRRDVERALPDISAATIRLVINELRDDGRIVSIGAGAGARWRRTEVGAESDRRS